MIHGLNGAGGGTIVGSVMLRLTLPVAGAFIGGTMESCSSEELMCGLAGVMVGGLVGISAASIIDATLLAWAPPAKERGLQASVSAMPLKNGGGLVLGGAF